jgi:hypothetical protein
MAGPHFLAMRAGLIERGLLSQDHRLTDAGHAYVDALLERLPEEEAPCDPDGPRVRWNMRWPLRQAQGDPDA